MRVVCRLHPRWHSGSACPTATLLQLLQPRLLTRVDPLELPLAVVDLVALLRQYRLCTLALHLRLKLRLMQALVLQAIPPPMGRPARASASSARASPLQWRVQRLTRCGASGLSSRSRCCSRAGLLRRCLLLFLVLLLVALALSTAVPLPRPFRIWLQVLHHRLQAALAL